MSAGKSYSRSMPLTFMGLVKDIWGPSHPYSARLRVKGEVGCDMGGVRPKRHQRMMKGVLD